MKKTISAITLTLGLLQAAYADDNNEHFPSLKSADVETAICNIQQYNKKLSAITSKDQLSPLDMVKVHELTYTLENAVNYLKETLEQVSVDLEVVHKASERLDAEVIKNSGEKYLAPTNKMAMAVKC